MRISLLSTVLPALAGAASIVRKEDSTQEPELAFSPPFYPSPWMDPQAAGWQEAYAKAKEFVSQLTLLEKVNLTTGVGWMSDRCVGNVGSIPRLGMRGLCMQDGPVGIRFTDYNSVFPSGQLSAATFDRSLMYRRGNAIGSEHKAKGIDVVLAPVAGPIGRSPLGGRNWEGFSPDPYLTGQGMSVTVRGMQDAGVIACAKHFVGNEQEHFRQAPEEIGRGVNITDSLSSNIDDKTMHELYMWPFADAVRAGVGSVMCAYTQVNNSYSCQNSKLLNGLLKDELGFQGFVMSDWQAQHSGVSSAVAGLDMSMPGDTLFNTGLSFWGANLTLAVLNGTVPEWRIDDMAMRIMTPFFKVGLTLDRPDINFSAWTLDTFGFEHPFAQENIELVNEHVDVRAEHGQLIREIAASGTVLLKNTGILPLNKPKFIAVIGEDAGPNIAGPNGCDNRGCNNGTLGMAWGSGTAEFPYLVTPDMGLMAQAVADGSRYESILSNHNTAATNKLVSQAGVIAIVFVNANSGEGFVTVDNNVGDRNDLFLFNSGDELIKNVSSRCANTIVVIHSTGPVLVTDWYDSPNITAILWAGVPGQESGSAITDILYGRVNPAGRTPFTWGATRESYGVDLIYEPNNGEGAPQDTFSEGVFIDYRHFDRQNATSGDDAPIYEFGFGLSYTSFAYSNLQIVKRDAPPYKPTTGQTIAAPELGNFSTDLNDYVFPADQARHMYKYIYPYLNTSSSGQEASTDPYYGEAAEQFLPPGALDGSPRPRSGPSGQPGGSPRLWDVLYTVTATVTNTGRLVGDEVAQLYVGLGGPEDPVRVLRGFDRLRIEPGESGTFTAHLTRRDLSSWDTTLQDWVISDYDKTLWVGGSSRKLSLVGELGRVVA